MPWIHSTAGRHAADRERERAAQRAHQLQLELQHEARSQVARALKARGIRVLEVLEDGESQVHAHCSVDRVHSDSVLIDATLTEYGFEVDPSRLSRYRQYAETVYLRNPATGVRLVAVIHRLGVLSRPAEAA